MPTIVVYDERAQKQIHTDVDAFTWLKTHMEQLAGEFTAYDSGVMSSCLSDQWAFLESTDEGSKPMQRSYAWADHIGTLGVSAPLVAGSGNQSFASSSKKSSQEDDEYQRYIARRNQELPVNGKPSADKILPLLLGISTVELC